MSNIQQKKSQPSKGLHFYFGFNEIAPLITNRLLEIKNIKEECAKRGDGFFDELCMRYGFHRGSILIEFSKYLEYVSSKLENKHFTIENVSRHVREDLLMIEDVRIIQDSLGGSFNLDDMCNRLKNMDNGYNEIMAWGIVGLYIECCTIAGERDGFNIRDSGSFLGEN